MHLLIISLLTILAGTLLLAKFRKEAAGKLFACISWFFIVVGCLLFICFVIGGVCRISQQGCPWSAKVPTEIGMDRCHHMGMPGAPCCPMGMEKGGCCAPHGMMCPQRPGCMGHDSTMKACPKMMKPDSTKALPPRK